MEGTIRTWIEAPKCAHVSSFLIELAWQLMLDIEITTDKGFIRETIFFKVVGDKNSLVNFQHSLYKKYGWDNDNNP